MSDFVPLYRQISDKIASRIRRMEWKYGEKLPSAKELCEEFDVSIITVKAALKDLQNNGMIRTVKGSGSFADWKPEKDYSLYPHNFISHARKIQISHALLNPTPLYEYIMRQLADTFMRNNPGISINFVNIIPGSANDPYLALLSSGKTPCCGEFFWHALYSKQDALYPLEGLPGFEDLKKELYPQAFYPTCDSMNEEHIHALYLYFDIPSFLLVNQKRLQESGINDPPLSMSFEKMQDCIKRLEKCGKCHPLGMSRPLAFHNVKYYLEFLGQDIFASGKTTLNREDAAAIFDSPGAEKSLAYLQDFFMTGNFLNRQPYENFAFDKVGILPFSGTWALHLLAMLNPSANYQAYLMPPLPGYKRYHSFLSGYSVGIFRKGTRTSEQLQATWEWLQFLFFKGSQTLLSQNLYLPVRRNTTPYLYQKFPFLGNMVKQQLISSIPQPDFVGLRQFLSLCGKELCNFMDSDISPEKCLKNIRKSLQSLL